MMMGYQARAAERTNRSLPLDKKAAARDLSVGRAALSEHRLSSDVSSATQPPMAGSLPFAASRPASAGPAAIDAKARDRARLEQLERRQQGPELSCPDCGESVRRGQLLGHYDAVHAWEHDCSPLGRVRGPDSRSSWLVPMGFAGLVALGVLRSALRAELGSSTWMAIVTGAMGLAAVMIAAGVLRAFFGSASLESHGDRLLLRQTWRSPVALTLPAFVRGVGDMESSYRRPSNGAQIVYQSAGVYLHVEFASHSLIANCQDETLAVLQGRWDPASCPLGPTRSLRQAHIRLSREDFYSLQLWLKEHAVLQPSPLSVRQR